MGFVLRSALSHLQRFSMEQDNAKVIEAVGSLTQIQGNMKNPMDFLIVASY
jgi:hypothetical protein